MPDVKGVLLEEDGVLPTLMEDGASVLEMDRGAQVLSDDFNRGDSTLTGTGTWFRAGSGTAPTIVSGQVVPQGTSQGVRFGTPSDSDDQVSEADHVTLDRPQVGVAVAMPGFANGDAPGTLPPWYVFHQNTAGGGSRISVKDSGVSVLVSGGPNFAAGDRIRLEYVNHILVAYVNGTQVLTFTPLDPVLGQRYQGFFNNSSGNNGIPILDNWVGGDL